MELETSRKPNCSPPLLPGGSTTRDTRWAAFLRPAKIPFTPEPCLHPGLKVRPLVPVLTITQD